MNNPLSRLLMKLYGSSREQEERRTRQTADAIRRRARERENELNERGERYSTTTIGAYRRGGR